MTQWDDGGSVGGSTGPWIVSLASMDNHAAAIMTRQFAFLEDLGFRQVDGTFALLGVVTYVTNSVMVRISWDWRDEIAGISISRRHAADPSEEPYWSGVQLAEILARRDAASREWWLEPTDLGQGPDQETIFARGAQALRTHCDDLLDGQNLELLDEIIAARPRRGVPGLDFPAEKPWAASQEGIWFFTDSQLPQTIEIYLERSQGDEPIDRAVAALKLPVGIRGTQDEVEIAAARTRLRELLDDPDTDVRRAAASSLGLVSDQDSLDRIIELLDLDPGDEPSPYAAAATFIALDMSPDLRKRVRDRLHEFAGRSPVAARQVKELDWRLTS
jgi:hypothetical protein